MRIGMTLDRLRPLMGRRGVFLSGIVVAGLSSPMVAQACSVCGGNAIGTDPGPGFNSSILFLLSMPYAVVGVIAGWLVYRYWRVSGHRRKGSLGPYAGVMERKKS